MTLAHVQILFQVIVFLLAISIHESPHAWMADRYGDATVRMLGRIALNPIKHIDVFGTIILLLIVIPAHFPVLGWAKPAPESVRRTYDMVGWFGLPALVYLGGNLLGQLIYPVIGFFDSILLRNV
jgi:Zn-dependent protease